MSRPNNDGPVSLGNCRATKETEKGLMVIGLEVSDGNPQWLPKSAIHDNSEVWKKGQEGDIVVKEWFADKLGVI